MPSLAKWYIRIGLDGLPMDFMSFCQRSRRSFALPHSDLSRACPNSAIFPDFSIVLATSNISWVRILPSSLVSCKDRLSSFNETETNFPTYLINL
jgi:hypothetical protein